MAEKDDDIELAKLLAGQSNHESGEGIDKSVLGQYKSILNEVDSWSLPEVDIVAGYLALREKIASTQEKKEATVIPMTRRRWSLIAASISLLIVSFFLLRNLQKEVEIRTAYGETKEIVFPDGSQALLNANTVLAYQDDDWLENPVVSLSQGEAYFYGKHSKGFRVNANNNSVEVIGTRFGIKLINEYFLVNCYDGSVAVEVGDDIHQLNKGEFFRLGEDKKKIAGTIEDEFPLWIDGDVTKFENAPLFEVFRALEDQFGVVCTFEKDIDLNQLYTGSFVHTKVGLALKMVCDPLGLKYKRLSKNQYKVY